MFSIIYTPTEGDAIQNYSRLFRKPEGCFLNIKDQGMIEQSLANFGNEEDVDYIVVSDGEEVCYKAPNSAPSQAKGWVDPWHRRSGCRRHTHLSCQACDHDSMCRYQPCPTTPSGAGLRNRCMYWYFLGLFAIQLTQLTSYLE